jgi:hypothetical protein
MTWQIKRQMLGLEKRKTGSQLNKDDKCHATYSTWYLFYGPIFTVRFSS